jgi:tetratricopeptide (TPR) repeat protein
LMLAEETVAKHRDQALKAYLDIFRALSKEFDKRRFVLIFDQFEHVGKPSTDFFLNFVKSIMPEDRFHIIVSFRTDDITWNDPSVRNAYEELEQKLINDLDTEKVSLEGISAEDIGRWIKRIRGISLPLVPDLERISENSAGLPLLLNEWIKTSERLNYEEISRDKLCSQIVRLEKGLDKEDLVRLYKMSILIQPLRYEKLARYLSTQKLEMSVDDVRPMIKQLSEHRIFDPQFKWFKHDLVKECFEDGLDPEEMRSYHNRAAEFFERLAQQLQRQKELERRRIETERLNNNDDSTGVSIELEENDNYFVGISIAYHLHMAGENYEKSFTHNEELGRYASSIGDLDIAERSYKRAIADAEHLGRTEDKMECLYEITANVYYIWGRYNEALYNYQLLLKHYNNINNAERRGSLLNDMAGIYDKKGEYDQAMKLYNESLEITRQLGDQHMIGRTLNNMAVIHGNKGEYDQAMKLYNESLEIARQLGDRQGIAYALNNMALLHYEKGEYDQAMKLYNESLEVKKELGDRQGIAYALNNMANIYSKKEQYDQAMKLYNESLEITRQLGDQYMIGSTLNNISTIFFARHEYDESFYNASQAHEILAELDVPELQRSVDILSYIKEEIGNEAYQRLTEEFRKR